MESNIPQGYNDDGSIDVGFTGGGRGLLSQAKAQERLDKKFKDLDEEQAGHDAEAMHQKNIMRKFSESEIERQKEIQREMKRLNPDQYE